MRNKRGETMLFDCMKLSREGYFPLFASQFVHCLSDIFSLCGIVYKKVGKSGFPT